MRATSVTMITGAAGDLGSAVAHRLASDGGALVLVDRDKASLGELREQLGSAAPVMVSSADVTDEGQVVELVAEVLHWQGGLTAVLNDAGIPGGSFSIAEHPLEDFVRTVNVNLIGAFLVLKHTLPVLAKQSDSWVVNTASAAGLRANERRGAYAASKAGLIQLSRACALEYASQGVRINTICPGPLDGRLFLEIEEGMQDSEEFRGSFVQNIALGRIGSPEEVASVVEFLLRAAPSYLTGASIPIDGARR